MTPIARSWTSFRLLRLVLAWTALYVLIDFAAATVCRQVIPWWDPTRAERAYRTRSELYHHGLAPKVATTAAWGGAPYPYRTNSLGFRDADTTIVPLVSPRRRTLLMGDSFTEGVGVPYEASYAGLLNRAALSYGGEVLNSGVMSYSPSLHFRKARHLLEEVGLEVDAIVVAVDVSDPYDEVERYRVAEDGRIASVEAPEALPRRIALWLRTHTVWGRTLGALVLAQERTARPLPVAVGNMPSTWACQGATPTAKGALGLARAAEGLDSLVALTRRHRIPLAVVVYPWEDQILRHEHDSCQLRYWERWAGERQVTLVNLYPLFLGSMPAESVVTRYFIPYDVHWNAAGHKLLADSLLATAVGRLIGAGGPPSAGVVSARHAR